MAQQSREICERVLVAQAGPEPLLISLDRVPGQLDRLDVDCGRHRAPPRVRARVRSLRRASLMVVWNGWSVFLARFRGGVRAAITWSSICQGSLWRAQVMRRCSRCHSLRSWFWSRVSATFWPCWRGSRSSWSSSSEARLSRERFDSMLPLRWFPMTRQRSVCEEVARTGPTPTYSRPQSASIG